MVEHTIRARFSNSEIGSKTGRAMKAPCQVEEEN